MIGTTFVWRLGDGLFTTALGYIALTSTGSSFWVGAQYATSLVSAAVAAAFLGSWLDRQRSTHALGLGACGYLVAIGIIVASLSSVDEAIAGLLVATAIAGMSFVMIAVTLSAAVTAAVPPEHRLLGYTTNRSAQLIASALAGLALSALLYVIALRGIMAIASALILLFWSLARYSLRSGQKFGHNTADRTSTIRIFLTSVCESAPQRLVLAMVVSYGLFVAPFLSQLPVLATELTGNSKDLGWLSATYFAGGVLSMGSGYVSTRVAIPLSRRALMSCGLSGIWLLALTLTLRLAQGELLVVLGFVFVFLLGHSTTMIVSVYNVAAQDYSHKEHRRRMLAALIFFGSMVGATSALAAGWWVENHGLVLVLFVCGIGLAVLSILQLKWRQAVDISALQMT